MRNESGCVYFIRRVNSMRYVKIGWALWPEERLRKLQTGSPEHLVIAALLQAQTRDDERALHKRFAQCRRSGEWFHVKAELLQYLRQLCGWTITTGPARCPRYYERRDRERDKIKRAIAAAPL